jgi:hypothetical protein
MKRIHIFLFALVITMTVLLTLGFVSWYYSFFSPTSYMDSWMSQMWGGSSNYGDMGGMMGGGTTTSVSYFWIIPLVLGGVVAIAVIGVVFYLMFPELKYIRGNTTCKPSASLSGIQSETTSSVANGITNAANTNASRVANSCDVLLKSMTPEEQKVLNVLISHNGKYLQKYVVKEAGLSRLKTHRIIARFTKRGIVSVKEFGNTNEIEVSAWVKA